MFAFLALAGDLGCTFGPMLVGLVSEKFNNDLKTGLLSITFFSIIMIFGVSTLFEKKKRKN